MMEAYEVRKLVSVLCPCCSVTPRNESDLCGPRPYLGDWAKCPFHLCPL